MTTAGSSPKVSVCVITYNHEKYIRQCLQSIVDQNPGFDYEVIVGEDCSTDGTRAIVQEFVDRYPYIFRAIFQEKNTRGTKNFLDVHAAARGEYIAHLDGDDWMLPGKLAKQAEFLDAHPQCSFVVHAMRMVSEDGRRMLGLMPNRPQPEVSSLERLVRDYLFFAHSSKMYRRSANIFTYPEDEDVIDFVFHIEHASLGDIGYIPEPLGCYRQVQGGISGRTGERLYHLFFHTLRGFDRARELGARKEVVDYAKAKYLIGAALVCLRRGDPVGYCKFIEMSRQERGVISFSHRCLYSARNFPLLIKLADRVRSVLMGRIVWLHAIRSRI